MSFKIKSKEVEQERRRKISIATKKHWTDKKYVKKQCKSRKDAWANDLNRHEAQSKQIKALWENRRDELVTKISNATKDRYKDKDQYNAIVKHCRKLTTERSKKKDVWQKNLQKSLCGKRSWNQYKTLYKGCSGVLWMRSGWEVLFAEWLDKAKIKWIYEPINFYIGVGSWTNRTYKPDFYLPDLDVFIEIKGRLTKREERRLKKFRKLYPDLHWFMLKKEELEIIGVLEVKRCNQNDLKSVQIKDTRRLNKWLRTLVSY